MQINGEIALIVQKRKPARIFQDKVHAKNGYHSYISIFESSHKQIQTHKQPKEGTNHPSSFDSELYITYPGYMNLYTIFGDRSSI